MSANDGRDQLQAEAAMVGAQPVVAEEIGNGIDKPTGGNISEPPQIFPFVSTEWISGQQLVDGHRILCQIQTDTGLTSGSGCVPALLQSTIVDDFNTTISSTDIQEGIKQARLLNMLFVALGMKRTTPALYATAARLRPCRQTQKTTIGSSDDMYAVSAVAQCSDEKNIQFVPILCVYGSLQQDYGNETALPTVQMTWFGVGRVLFDTLTKKARFFVQTFSLLHVTRELVSRSDVLMPRQKHLAYGFMRTPPIDMALPVYPPTLVPHGINNTPKICFRTLRTEKERIVSGITFSAAAGSGSSVAIDVVPRSGDRLGAQLACPDFGGGVDVRRVAMPGMAMDARDASSIRCTYHPLIALRSEEDAGKVADDTRLPMQFKDQMMSRFCATHDAPGDESCVARGTAPIGAPKCPAVLKKNSACARWAAGASRAALDASAREFCDKWRMHPACDCLKWDDASTGASAARRGARDALELHSAPLNCWFHPCRRSSSQQYLQVGDPSADATCPTISCQQLIGAFSKTGNASVDIVDSTIGFGMCANERKARKDTGSGDAVCAGDICTPCIDGDTCSCSVDSVSGERTCKASKITTTADSEVAAYVAAVKKRAQEKRDAERKLTISLWIAGGIISLSVIVGAVWGLFWRRKR